MVNVRVIYESWLIRFLRHFSKGLDGLTLGHTIRILYSKENLVAPLVVAHEMVHVQQYERYGFIGFLVRYLWYSIKYGYFNNPLEVEAREISGY